MSSLCGNSQACGVAGRSMTDNLMVLKMAQDYCTTHNQPFFMLGADLAKAFDRVGHSWLFAVLRKMGFGPIFMGFVQAMYRNIGFSVQVNGAFTIPSLVHRGIRQGCALSMLLFVLSLEPFLYKIMSNVNICGILVPHPGGGVGQLKFTCYADDLVLLLDAALSKGRVSWNEFWALAKKFELASKQNLICQKPRCVFLAKGSESKRTLFQGSISKVKLKSWGRFLVGGPIKQTGRG